MHTHMQKSKARLLNSDDMYIMWYSCCYCCCGNETWQCVRQGNFRQNKLFLNSVGETDGFCLKMNSFAPWKFIETDEKICKFSSQYLVQTKGLSKCFGTIFITCASLVYIFSCTFPKWKAGQVKRQSEFFLLYFYWIESSILRIFPKSFKTLPSFFHCFFSLKYCFNSIYWVPP